MKRIPSILLALALVLPAVTPAFAETTLEKIGRTGVLTIGTRTGSSTRTTSGSAFPSTSWSRR
jgi:hypothetical protein